MLPRLAYKSSRSPLLTLSRWYNPYLCRTNRTAMENTSLDVSSGSKPAAQTASTVPGALFKPIVWIDCEMTGLDHINDHIIEICCIITDGKLNVVDEEGYESVVHYDRSVLDKMGPWCVEHHGQSGLTQKVVDSVKTREQVEQELLAYIKKWIPEPRKGVLAGNSVHMDRLFMLREFPAVIDHLFYRIIDVSTIMEVSHRHNPQLARVTYKKTAAHTAKADILESIAQLRFYQDHYLKSELETQPFVQRRRVEIQAENAACREREASAAAAAAAAAGTKRALQPESEADADTDRPQQAAKMQKTPKQ